MKISELSEKTGISAKNIRYYENVDLLEQPERDTNGYRVYNEKDVETLKFIKSSRELGFPLKDVKALIALWQNKNRSSKDVKEMAIKQLEEITKKIEDLKNIKETLDTLIHSCSGDERPDCPILKGLSSTCDHEKQ